MYNILLKIVATFIKVVSAVYKSIFLWVTVGISLIVFYFWGIVPFGFKENRSTLFGFLLAAIPAVIILIGHYWVGGVFVFDVAKASRKEPKFIYKIGRFFKDAYHYSKGQLSIEPKDKSKRQKKTPINNRLEVIDVDTPPRKKRWRKK